MLQYELKSGYMSTKEEFNQKVAQITSSKEYKNPKKFTVYLVRGNQKSIIIENIESNYKSAAIFIDNLRKLGENIDFKNSSSHSIALEFLEGVMDDFRAFMDEINAHKNIQAILKIYENRDNLDGYFVSFEF